VPCGDLVHHVLKLPHRDIAELTLSVPKNVFWKSFTVVLG
jgi:hypothetical protein